MQITNNLGYLLNHIAFVMGRQSDMVLNERLGIGFSQFKIMMVLRYAPHVQQKEIADRLGQTEASISRQIKLLTDKGLLQSLKRPENRREHITTLTLKGENLTDEALELLNQYHSPVFARLSEHQQQLLIETMKIMHEEICSGDKPGSCHHIFDK